MTVARAGAQGYLRSEAPRAKRTVCKRSAAAGTQKTRGCEAP